MERVENDIKLQWWPSPQDYNESIQNPALNTIDSELRQAAVSLGPLGIPQPVCGAFASVYHMQSGAKEVAVRCFLRDVADQAERYAEISRYVLSDELPYTVDFEYIRQGILVNSSWFPLLKMDWVRGQTLEEYVLANLQEPNALNILAAEFMRMCGDLRSAGIAHGDLQHGNIIISPGCELRLVDYDGMYVPSMSGLTATELGHRNYQHPRRDATHFGTYLDNFSAWVIYTSIMALAVDPALSVRMGVGDDCLLFKSEDFRDPRHSPVFHALENMGDDDLRKLSRFVRFCLSVELTEVPPLSLEVSEVNVEELSRDIRTERGSFASAVTDTVASHATLGSNVAAPSKSADFMRVPKVSQALSKPGPRKVKLRHDDTLLGFLAFPLLVGGLCVFMPALWFLWLIVFLLGLLSQKYLWREYTLVRWGNPIVAEIIEVPNPLEQIDEFVVADFADLSEVMVTLKSVDRFGTATLYKCPMVYIWTKDMGGPGAFITLLCAPKNPQDFLVYPLSQFKAE